jgi:excisionase family DNA binding protein
MPVALTIGEAARRLAVSQMTIRRLLERGELVRVAVGRSVRVLAKSVNKFAERGGASNGN